MRRGRRNTAAWPRAPAEVGTFREASDQKASVGLLPQDRCGGKTRLPSGKQKSPSVQCGKMKERMRRLLCTGCKNPEMIFNSLLRFSPNAKRKSEWRFGAAEAKPGKVGEGGARPQGNEDLWP